jgi:hypothetical protein
MAEKDLVAGSLVIASLIFYNMNGKVNETGSDN